jgi:hypothetical protein
MSVWGSLQSLWDARAQGDRRRARALEELVLEEIDFARRSHRRRQFPAPRRVRRGFAESDVVVSVQPPVNTPAGFSKRRY